MKGYVLVVVDTSLIMFIGTQVEMAGLFGTLALNRKLRLP